MKIPWADNHAVDLGQLHYIFLDDINMKDNSALSSSATELIRMGFLTKRSNGSAVIWRISTRAKR